MKQQSTPDERHFPGLMDESQGWEAAQGGDEKKDDCNRLGTRRLPAQIFDCSARKFGTTPLATCTMASQR
jgi:hypothetical protein